MIGQARGKAGRNDKVSPDEVSNSSHWCARVTASRIEATLLRIATSGAIEVGSEGFPGLDDHAKSQYSTPIAHKTPAITFVFAQCVIVGDLSFYSQ